MLKGNNSVWCVFRNMLFRNCECPEEGTRNVVSECMGKLTLVDPTVLIASLRKHLSDPSPLARSTVVTAIKFTISDQVGLNRPFVCTMKIVYDYMDKTVKFVSRKK